MYYTPTIEEIHIGFECELFYQADNKLARTENLKWHPTVIDKNNFQRAHYLIKEKKIRVKNVDLDDLYSLGFFVLTRVTIDRFSAWDLGGYRIYFNMHTKCNIIKTYIDRDVIVFKGVIKNKSVLKLILGITQ